MKKIRISIFGSSSHIAKGLIYYFSQDKQFCLHLYTRSASRVHNFLASIGRAIGKDCIIHKGYNDFLKVSYDAVINCIGPGTKNKLGSKYYRWFTLTEEYDNLIIQWLLKKCPRALYISLSSGAVYGRQLCEPVNKHSVNPIKVNHISYEDYYGIARLNAEAKHRSFGSLRIVDLRVFSCFSRFIDLADGYFITELLKSLLENKAFAANQADFLRDYAHPFDIYSLIRKCLGVHKLNTAIDVVSAKPVRKSIILDYFASEYGLKYKLASSIGSLSATGQKDVYCSRYDNAASLGYKPLYGSMDTIKSESKYIINRRLEGK